MGFSQAKESDFAKHRPTRSEPISPGPDVTAMPSIAPAPEEASPSAFSTTGTMALMCSREASSGTTPP